MARKSGFVRRNNVMRRETQWFAGTTTSNGLAAASTAVLAASLNAAALALRPFTVIRTRGWVHMRSDQVAASELVVVHYGLAVVSDQAVGIGVTAVPTPATDNGSDLWFTYVSGAVFENVDANVSGVDQLLIPIDSKAMRKVEDGQDVVAVVETDAQSLGAQATAFFRLLIKLH